MGLNHKIYIIIDEYDNFINAMYALAKTGDIKPTVEIVKEFLVYCSNIDTENFNEKMLKFVF